MSIQSNETNSEEANNPPPSSPSSPIKIFLRTRPSKRASSAITLDIERSVASFDLQKVADFKDDWVNNTRTIYQFPFETVFGPESKQDELFEIMAKPLIDDAFEGINGCLFAYGMTGSGKTFTMTGGVERYADRGIVPRSLQYAFKLLEELHSTKKAEVSIAVSYLEIYNAQGYDLLSQRSRRLDDLPKIFIREAENGDMHLQNLTINAAPSEEEALNLLFLGDTNRVVAETPMNDVSTRSHCIFIMHVSVRQPKSDLVKRSKLHFVDLAGSERASKTGIDGKTLTESKHINVSLHYLEQVIVALSEREHGMRSHIPYRNSMMTTILRDSIGGNSKTVMIANIAVEEDYLDEAISTCRFAQRVGQIKNVVSVNEELDKDMVIENLRAQVAGLKEEVAVLKAAMGEEQRDNPLTSEQKALLKERVARFVKDGETLVCDNVSRIRAAFDIMRDMILAGSQGEAVQTVKMVPESGVDDRGPLDSLVPTETIRRQPLKQINPRMVRDSGSLTERGKTLGEIANKARATVAKLRARLDSMRVCDSMRSADGEVDESGADYVKLKLEIEQSVAEYKDASEGLRLIKKELERLRKGSVVPEVLDAAYKENECPETCL